MQDTNQLLIGTINGLVLTQNISEYLSAYSGPDNYDDEGHTYALGNGDDYEGDAYYNNQQEQEGDEYANMDMDAEIRNILGKGQDGMSALDKIRLEQMQLMKQDQTQL